MLWRRRCHCNNHSKQRRSGSRSKSHGIHLVRRPVPTQLRSPRCTSVPLLSLHHRPCQSDRRNPLSLHCPELAYFLTTRPAPLHFLQIPEPPHIPQQPRIYFCIDVTLEIIASYNKTGEILYDGAEITALPATIHSIRQKIEQFTDGRCRNHGARPRKLGHPTRNMKIC